MAEAVTRTSFARAIIITKSGLALAFTSLDVADSLARTSVGARFDLAMITLEPTGAGTEGNLGDGVPDTMATMLASRLANGSFTASTSPTIVATTTFAFAFAIATATIRAN